MSRRRSLLLLLGLLPLLAVACDLFTPERNGLRIIQGGGLTDTIWAVHAEELIVELTDEGGAPIPGAEVVIQSGYLGDEAPMMRMRPASGGSEYYDATEFTDASGRARFIISNSYRTGRGWVRATAPGRDDKDSVSYIITPGRLTGFDLAPSDTAVRMGNLVTLRARANDSYGNRRNEPIQWSMPPSAVAELASAGRVRGKTFGRALVRATTGTFTDSVWVNVVPAGTLAAVDLGDGGFGPERVVRFNTDGTLAAPVDAAPLCASGTEWSADGSRVLYVKTPPTSGCFESRLYAAPLGSTPSRLRTVPGTLVSERWPRATRGGDWIYFEGWREQQLAELWRVRPSGAGSERVGPAAASGEEDHYPFPSPDGTEVVYMAFRAPDWAIELRVLDVATRQTRSLGVSGYGPSWSPDGSTIIYVREGEVRLIDPDGTNDRAFHGLRMSEYETDPPTWSPDSKWVALKVKLLGPEPLYGGLVLVNVASGLVLRMGWAIAYKNPSWKPAAP